MFPRSASAFPRETSNPSGAETAKRIASVRDILSSRFFIRYGLGHAELSGLFLSQHCFQASRTSVSFTLHQPLPGESGLEFVQSFIVSMTSPGSPRMADCK